VTLDDLNKGFLDLITAGLNHAIDTVRDGGEALKPFVVVESGPGARDFQRFDGLEQATAFAKAVDSMNRVVIVYDGVATTDGAESEAILVSGRDRGAENPVLVAQRYSPKKFLKKFATIGTPTVV
jgi:hypothetical protein